jgi:hypothetical protein
VTGALEIARQQRRHPLLAADAAAGALAELGLAALEPARIAPSSTSVAPITPAAVSAADRSRPARRRARCAASRGRRNPASAAQHGAADIEADGRRVPVYST